MKHTLINNAAIVILFIILFLIFLYFYQDKMIYFPTKDFDQTPETIGLKYEVVAVKTKDGINISGWYIPAEKERGVLLFCHGNAGNISHRLDSIKIFNSLHLSIFIFDYRGYGNSEGKPSEQGTYLDAEAAWNFLTNIKNKSPEKIVIFGRSIGGAVAAETALRKNPAALIIESGFKSIPEIGAHHYPWLPVKLIAKYKYSTIDKIGLIKCPKLIIHSPDDEIVPFKHGKELYEKASSPKEFFQIYGSHNEGFIISGNVYIGGLKNFLDKYLITTSFR